MMGAQLVARVFASWTHLPDRPFRLLTYMAHITKDTNAVPTFWGGRDSLAEALGYRDLSPSVYRMVSRCIADLVSSGAIERAYVGHAGKRTEYRLTLKKDDSTVPPQDDSTVTLRMTPESYKDDSGVLKGCTPQSPLGTIRNQSGTQQESISSPNASVGSAMDRIAKARNSRLGLVRSRMDGEAAS